MKTILSLAIIFTTTLFSCSKEENVKTADLLINVYVRSKIEPICVSGRITDRNQSIFWGKSEICSNDIFLAQVKAIDGYHVFFVAEIPKSDKKESAYYVHLITKVNPPGGGVFIRNYHLIPRFIENDLKTYNLIVDTLITVF